MKISALLIVKDEEEKIERCLKSLTDIVDEIIVVDTGSRDNTVSIAKKYTSNIYFYTWKNDFANARNYSIKQSSGDYNLIIDADEYITAFDRDGVYTFMQRNNHLGIITVKNIIEQNNEAFIQPDYITRFIPKNIFFTGKIHEQVDSSLDRHMVPIEITHDGYYQRSDEKFLRNIALLENELKHMPNNVYVLYQLSNEYFGLEKFKQAKPYFEKCYSLIKPSDSFYPQFITNYISFCKTSKAFDLGLDIILENEEHLQNYPDFYFSSGEFYLEFVLDNIQENIDYVQVIETCYLACLEIGEIDHHASLTGVGSFLAQYNLGIYYELNQDIETAKKYFTLASSHNYKPAIERLKIYNLCLIKHKKTERIKRSVFNLKTIVTIVKHLVGFGLLALTWIVLLA